MSESHQREAAIFDAAMELPPEQRAAHLDHACGGDAALRQRIESLLKAGESKCEFLDSPPDPAAAKTLSVLPASSEKAGDKIGRYKLLQQIGEGGCGVVYMAEQEEPVSRRVALKVIKLGLDTKSVIARFEAERQALALMDHPNIAKVLDAGATETGRPYFVMELVRGMKITEYCDEARLSTNARLDLFIQVCQAIQHAHQKGIIHRDIKPSNILVTINDGVPVPKVIDFGVAKATGGLKLTNKTVFTAFEQFIGTPAYMSPEQAVLTSLDIDTRSDIYALGVLLYELLTGKTPFDAKELLAIGLDEMRRTIREQEPPRPSTRLSTLPGQELSTTAQRRSIEAPKLVSELRGDLDWIVMKALEKDRARRYETANGLASDIRRHLNNEPVVACPPSRAYRFQKLVRRNKLAFAAAGAVAAALMIGLGISTWMFFREREATHQQERLRQRAETESAKSREVAQFLKDMLKGVGPSVAMGRDQTMLREILDETAERVGKDLSDQPEVQVELMNTLGFAYWELGRWDSAEKMYRSSLDIMRKLWGDEHREIAVTLHNLAELLRRRGQNRDAEVAERQALAINQGLFGSEHPAVAASLGHLAFVLTPLDPDEAESLFHQALSMNRKLLGEEHSELAICLSRFAWMLRAQGRFPEAEAKCREAVAIQTKLLGQKSSGLAPHVELGWTLYFLSEALERQGKFSEADAALREANTVVRNILPDLHPDRLELLANWIYFKVRRNDWEQAETLLRDTLAMRRKMAGNNHPVLQQPLEILGDLMFRQGKSEQAEAAYRELCEVLGASAQKGNVPALNSLAWLLATCSVSAIRDGSNAVVFAEKPVAATNRKNPLYLDTLAAACAEAGEFAKAINVQKEAVALLHDERMKKEFESRLKLYQSNSPYREP